MSERLFYLMTDSYSMSFIEHPFLLFSPWVPEVPNRETENRAWFQISDLTASEKFLDYVPAEYGLPENWYQSGFDELTPWRENGTLIYDAARDPLVEIGGAHTLRTRNRDDDEVRAQFVVLHEDGRPYAAPKDINRCSEGLFVSEHFAVLLNDHSPDDFQFFPATIFDDEMNEISLGEEYFVCIPKVVIKISETEDFYKKTPKIIATDIYHWVYDIESNCMTAKHYLNSSTIEEPYKVKFLNYSNKQVLVEHCDDATHSIYGDGGVRGIDYKYFSTLQNNFHLRKKNRKISDLIHEFSQIYYD